MHRQFSCGILDGLWCLSMPEAGRLYPSQLSVPWTSGFGTLEAEVSSRVPSVVEVIDYNLRAAGNSCSRRVTESIRVFPPAGVVCVGTPRLCFTGWTLSIYDLQNIPVASLVELSLHNLENVLWHFPSKNLSTDLICWQQTIKQRLTKCWSNTVYSNK